MASYSLADRFPPNPKYIRLMDPTSYSIVRQKLPKENIAPFLSKAPRVTLETKKLYTHKIYNTDFKERIPNITAFLLKKPRFPYESLSKEDLDEILCRCGIQTPCECPLEEEEAEDVICQAKESKRLYKGANPPSLLGPSISIPSKRHRGFDILTGGVTKQILDEEFEECPPFYDARVNEATAFYQGCKWSQWRSKRTTLSPEQRPGPADYQHERIPTSSELCTDKIKEKNRKTSRQLRFIESVQNRNILEGRPGPAHYYPQLPKGAEIESYGPKSERFPESSKYNVNPGPNTYNLRRDLDPPKIPACVCLKFGNDRGGFGSKAERFKWASSVGPSPAEYSIKKPSKILCCSTAPFSSTAKRFKNAKIDESSSEDEVDECENDEVPETTCTPQTWQFNSKTIRMHPLKKKFKEPSPGDFLPKYKKNGRTFDMQTIAPFNSSEGRFQPWYDWLPVASRVKTPGPCIYNLEKYKCNRAVNRGPLYRSVRFKSGPATPAPNQYQRSLRLPGVLETYNERLKNNVRKVRRFNWDAPTSPRTLTFKERELLLFDKAIAIIDEPEYPSKLKPKHKAKSKSDLDKNETKLEGEQPKLLRSLLYRRPVPNYY